MIKHALLGLLMGFFTATSGWIKDSMFEPFELRKYVRSIYVSGIGGSVCYVLFPDTHPFLIMSFSFLFERLLFEIWKAFLRPIARPTKFSDPLRDTRWFLRRWPGWRKRITDTVLEKNPKPSLEKDGT